MKYTTQHKHHSPFQCNGLLITISNMFCTVQSFDKQMLYKTGLKKVVSRDMPYDKKSCSFFLFL
jgi:hypothetical protein